MTTVPRKVPLQVQNIDSFSESWDVARPCVCGSDGRASRRSLRSIKAISNENNQKRMTIQLKLRLLCSDGSNFNKNFNLPVDGRSRIRKVTKERRETYPSSKVTKLYSFVCAV